ncbi:MAG: YIP1 family protein [Kurthia sp.]|nr:YIP1 family protein [Candidatus Kurthia equi]
MEHKLNPFVSIWRQPRETIRYLLVNKSFWYIAILSFFGAWASALIASVDEKTTKEASDLVFTKPSFLMEIVTSILAGIATILIGTAILAFFYWIIGKLFGGKGVYSDLYKGSMLTMLPYGVMLPFLLIWLVIAPNSFYGITDTASAIDTVFSVLFGLATIVLTIFVFILTIVMISEVHQFSKWRAFFTMIIPVVALIVFILAVLAIIATVLLGNIF